MANESFGPKENIANESQLLPGGKSGDIQREGGDFGDEPPALPDRYVEAELEFYRPDWEETRKEFGQFPSRFPKLNPGGTYPKH